ncbi:MAG: VacJ family lipoprotein [Rhodospirillales bacterium]|nr:VacJ family lipoprotein [Rhodospirillales bacterium]MBO6788342.1 VacJ family lipoprotein [Rhodospirillales bacterium]
MTARGLRAIAVAGLLLLAGCATPPPVTDKDAYQEYVAENDPVEPLNRAVFAFNRALDEGLFQPAARAYRDVVPLWFRQRIGSAIDNLRAPVIFMNDILQGEFDRAMTTFVRFTVNSTLGLAGLNDVARDSGLEMHDEDFGQTLAVWGSEPGPYLMLPVLGPSNPRDVVGTVVDFLADPFNAWAQNTGREELSYARTGVAALHARAGLLDLTDDLEKNSIDLYAATRSLYRQTRANAISNGNVTGPDVSSAPADFPELGDTKEISGKP